MQCCSDQTKHSKEEKQKRPDITNEHQIKDSKLGITSKWPYLCGVGVVGALIAVTVFKVSLSNLLFYGAVIACPLMHVFMMKGHGTGDDRHEEKKHT